MATLDAGKLSVVKRTLHQPSLEEIKEVISEAVAKNFTESKVEIVDCPDLQQQPFTLASSGLGGNPTILEVGGPAYLLPTVQKDKLYDIRPLLKHIDHDKSAPAFVIGAGAAPWPYLNTNAEMMMNVTVSPSGLKNETRFALVNKSNGTCELKSDVGDETRFALLANLFMCEGKLGKVLKVHAKNRIGNDDFIACMQKALAARYKDQLVGLGGTFLLKEGKAKQHVMQDFSKTPLKNVTDLNNWLQFYDMSAPLIAVGTFISAETDLDLRVQHFHSFSHHGEGGHYHIDTTPKTVEYLGYFNLGSSLYRVDQPSHLLEFGKD